MRRFFLSKMGSSTSGWAYIIADVEADLKDFIQFTTRYFFAFYPTFKTFKKFLTTRPLLNGKLHLKQGLYIYSDDTETNQKVFDLL